MPIRISTRGPKTGVCNICGSHGQLTEDHTPPKGCIRIGQVELHHIIKRLDLTPPQSKGRYSQNGVKYRTLCAKCNNGFLGTDYDPDFIAFVNQVGNYMNTTIQLPPTMTAKARPQRVMRSLLGHMCAQGVGRYEKGKFTSIIKDYFLDQTQPLPGEISIFYWAYPYKTHVIARDCMLMDLHVQESAMVWFLKFFPIAFLIAFDKPTGFIFHKPTGFQFNLAEMSQWRALSIDDEVELPVSLNEMPPDLWPEAPTKASAVVYGEEAIVSFDQKKLNS